MPIPDLPFQSPLPLRDLLARLGDAWPSPDAWPFIPARTESVDATTPVTLLAFDRDALLTPDEATDFDRLVQGRRLRPYLSRDQLTDIHDSLAHEFATLSDPTDIEIARRAYEPMLLRAINHYCSTDAFVSLKDWTGRGGRVVRGILADYR